jgi:Uncharacterized membrane-associated protein/domain
MANDLEFSGDGIFFPYKLFQKELYGHVSLNAKALYAFFANMAKKDNTTTVIFTIPKICKWVGCSESTAIRLLAELERNEFIEREKSHGKANIIHVKKLGELFNEVD